MEVVAPAAVTPAPFALCPRYNLLAVGMAPSAAARGDARESGASRVDVLRLLTSGEHDHAETLKGYQVQAPGLRKIAWSATPKNRDWDSDDDDYTKLVPVEKYLYPAGLLAGGFNNGAVRIWAPEPDSAFLCDLKTLSVPRKPKPVLILDKDPEKSKILEADVSSMISKMYSDIENISWIHLEDKEISQPKDEEDMKSWQLLDDAECFDWDLVTKEKPVVDYHGTARMKLLTETHELSGPVLGLSFSDLNPHWIATAAKSERICVHDLHYPVQLSKKKHEFNDAVSKKKNSQITVIKWSKICPTILASAGDAGVATIWDLRTPSPHGCLSAFTVHKDMCSSDVEFSWNNHMHFAISTRASATVKLWDMRNFGNSFHEYASGDSGVLSLSWNRLGQLLSSDTNGAISVYDVYNEKILPEMDLPHCDLGSTWTHLEDVVATLSSKDGLKLCRIGE